MQREEILRTPVKAIDLEKVKTITELVEAFKGTSIQSRNLGICAGIYEDMLLDPSRPTIFMGLSGALIAGGLRKVIRDAVAYGLVDVIVSTGAILYQDIYQARGYKHYMGDVNANDLVLREHMIDRIYDTYVDEEKFRETDTYISEVVRNLEPRPYSSREIMEHLARGLEDEHSIVCTAVKYGVPMFVPALNDSSIGIGLTKYYVENKEPRMRIDPIRDNWEITQIKIKSEKTGAVYVGGGVPKNYINDIEVIAELLGYEPGGHHYAIQITTDAPHWGGLSGSTLSEAQSWGKINRRARKGTVYVEATIGLPLLIGHLIHKGVWRQRVRPKFVWEGHTLLKIE